MNNDANEPPLKETEETSQKSREFTRRLALLKAEFDVDFPALRPALEKGLPLLLVTNDSLGEDLDPDSLRWIGGMIVLCRQYGTAVLFAKHDCVQQVTFGTQSV